MIDNPTIILDKSSVRSSSVEEIKLIQRHYTIILPQILVNEVLSGHAKSETLGTLAEKEISILKSLAKKLNSHGTYYYPDVISLVKSELLTGQSLPFTGQPIVFESKTILTKDGVIGTMIEEPKVLQMLSRWGEGDFTSEDIIQSYDFFHVARGLDLKQFKEQLGFNSENINGLSIAEISEMVRTIFRGEQKLFAEILLNFLFDITQVTFNERAEILERFKNANINIDKFAPYASYFFTVLLSFTLGIKSGAISIAKEGKAHLDLEYFFYLPFTKVICSGDNQFVDFFNAFSRPDQILFSKEDVRNELERIKQDSKYVKDSKNRSEKINSALFESTTYRLWPDNYIPTHFNRNLADEIALDEQKRIFDKLIRPMNEGLELFTNIPLNKAYASQYEGWCLNKRFNEVLTRAKEIFEIDKGWVK